MKRIGIDVGGTHTDIVLMEGNNILHAVKGKTSYELSDGIQLGIKKILFESSQNPQDIQAIMLGTTHFTNAVIQQKSLNKVAIIRLGLPATKLLEPMSDWPHSLKSMIHGATFLCHGGIEFTNKEISSLKKEEIEKIIDFVQEKNIESVAIISVFSPLNNRHELEIAQIFQEKLPQCHVSLSSKIGKLSLLQRENATILNASLQVLAGKMLDSLKKSFATLGIDAPLFISQNDGTLISATEAKCYPIKTFASGPTNSLRGAAYLSQLTEAIIVDIGGTTTDIGLLQHGFPIEAPLETRIAGIRTNFRMPHLISVGIGGGSRVDPITAQVGPKSVGYQLEKKALVFGGKIITASDLAVAEGLAAIGNPHFVQHLDRSFVKKGLSFIQETILKAIKNLVKVDKSSSLVLVGGAYHLLSAHLTEFKRIIRPKYAEVANAIGAAIAQISSEVNNIVDFSKVARREYLKNIKNKVIADTVKQGADINTIKIIEVEEIPLLYCSGNTFKIKVKAVGDLIVHK